MIFTVLIISFLQNIAHFILLIYLYIKIDLLGFHFIFLPNEHAKLQGYDMYIQKVSKPPRQTKSTKDKLANQV